MVQKQKNRYIDGAKLKFHREMRSLTQADLEDLTIKLNSKVTEKTIRRYEKGHSPGSLSVIKILAEALEIQPDELLIINETLNTPKESDEKTQQVILDKIKERLTDEALWSLNNKLHDYGIKDYQSLNLEIRTIGDEDVDDLSGETPNVHIAEQEVEWKAFGIEELKNGISKSYILSSDVGTGKTTFLRNLQLELLDKKEGIPVYIRASEIEEWKCYDSGSFIKCAREKLENNLSEEIPRELWSEITQKDLFLLIDGLDQIRGSGSSYGELLTKLLNGDGFSKINKIITSRPSAVVTSGNKLNASFLRLTPFDLNAQRAYFGKYYKRASEICGTRRDTLGIPMLAYMIRRLIEQGIDKQIYNRSSLYKQFMDYVLDVDKYQHDEIDLTFDEIDIAREVLREISFKALDRKSPDIQSVPYSFCREIAGKKALSLDKLLKLGIVNRDSRHTVNFAHQSFQEYLAAEYISDKEVDIQKVLAEKWNPKWKEVIKFLTGVKGQIVIEQVLSEQDNPIHSKLFLSAELVPEVCSISSGLRDEMSQKIENLLDNPVFAGDAKRFLLHTGTSKGLEVLVGDIRSEDHLIVKGAIHTLSEFKYHWDMNKDVTEEMVNLLEHENLTVVYATINAFAKLKYHKSVSKDVVERITGKLEHKDKDVVEAAIKALVELKDHKDIIEDIVEVIVGKLQHKDRKVVEAAIKALAELKNHKDMNKDIVKKIVNHLGHKEGWVVVATIESIAKLKDHKGMSKDIVGEIVDKLEHEKWWVVEAAIKALVELKDHKDMSEDIIRKIVNNLEHENGYLRHIVCCAIVELKDHKGMSKDIVGEIAGKLEHKDDEIVEAAIKALAELKNHKDMSKSIIEKIASKLEHKDWSIVNLTINALVELKDHKDMSEEIIGKIVGKFEHEYKWVIKTASEAFVKLKDHKNTTGNITERIASKLDRKDKYVVEATIKALVELKNREGMNESIVKKIVSKLEHKDGYIVRAAIDAVVELKNHKGMSENIVEKVAGKLEHKDEDVVEAAIKALVKLKNHNDMDKDVIEKIASKLKHKDKYVVKAAIEALVGLRNHKGLSKDVTGKIASKLEHKDEYVVATTIEALEKFIDHKDISNNIIKEIVGKLEHKDWYVVHTASEALAKLKYNITRDDAKRILSNSSFGYETLKKQYRIGLLK